MREPPLVEQPQIGDHRWIQDVSPSLSDDTDDEAPPIRNTAPARRNGAARVARILFTLRPPFLGTTTYQRWYLCQYPPPPHHQGQPGVTATTTRPR